MKKFSILLLIFCLLLPTNVLAAQEDGVTGYEASTLSQMTDSCLGDVIFSEDQVEIDDLSLNNRAMLYSTNPQQIDENEIKEMIEKYNKEVFLSIIGHEQNVPLSFSDDQLLLDELNARNIYLSENYGAGSTFTAYKFNLEYNNISVDGDKAKAVITRNIIFQTKLEDMDYPIDADLRQQEGYVLEKNDGQWKFINVIFNSEGIQNLALDELATNTSSDEWVDTFGYENLKRSQYEDTMTFTEMLNDEGKIDLDAITNPSIEYSKAYNDRSLLDSSIRASRAGYSKARCDAYAEKYGRTINNAYRWFDLDCTNFASQCIYAGGLPQSNYWYYRGPNNYSRSWTVVDDLRNFIMNHTLSVGYYQKLPDYPTKDYRGTLIQYSTGRHWVHSAIIRSVNETGIYVAEHEGREGPQHPGTNYSFHLHGKNLKNTRTFWIAKG